MFLATCTSHRFSAILRKEYYVHPRNVSSYQKYSTSAIISLEYDYAINTFYRVPSLRGSDILCTSDVSFRNDSTETKEQNEIGRTRNREGAVA